MKCSPRGLILIGLWIFLLGWTYLAIRKHLNEDTAFNHYEIVQGFQWPVVSICPMHWSSTYVSSKTFEEMEVEINRTMMGSYSFMSTFPKKGNGLE